MEGDGCGGGGGRGGGQSSEALPCNWPCPLDTGYECNNIHSKGCTQNGSLFSREPKLWGELERVTAHYMISK